MSDSEDRRGGDKNSADSDNRTEEISSSIALTAGARLQEYVISKPIGSGGFGITYLGRDSNLDKAVAVKEYFPGHLAYRQMDGAVQPRSSIGEDAEEYRWGLSRFVDEARVLARFEHQNVIRVLRYFEANGTAYIVMDFARGRPLSACIKEDGPMAEAQLKPLLLQLLDGLAVVHDAGMLHRDIKPQNIIVREDGSPVLIDFGAARQAIGGRSLSVTAIMSIGYSPFEQYNTRGALGPWTDIYALAATAYAAIVGEPPIEAIDRIQEDRNEPAVKAAKGRGSQAFLAAIDWALSPNAADRPQSIAEWRAALLGHALDAGGNKTVRAASMGGNKTVKARPGASYGTSEKAAGRGGGLPQIAAAAVLLLAVAGGAYLYTQSLDGGSGEASKEQKPQPLPDTASAAEAAKHEAAPAPQQRAQITPPPNQEQDRRERPPQETPPAPKPDPAVTKKDDNDFAAARYIGTPEAYQLYKRLHPEGRHIGEIPQGVSRRGAATQRKARN